MFSFSKIIFCFKLHKIPGYRGTRLQGFKMRSRQPTGQTSSNLQNLNDRQWPSMTVNDRQSEFFFNLMHITVLEAIDAIDAYENIQGIDFY